MRRTKVVSLLLGLCMALCMVFVPASAAYGSEVNEKILEARKGILQVAVLIEVDGKEAAYAHVGTGFLVGGNDGAQTVITNYHVAHELTEEDVRVELEIPAESKVTLSLSIVVKRDVRISASIVNESAQADFSILKLEQPIYDREPLVLADSDGVATTQEVFALGFPGVVQDIQNDEIYTSDDVTVTAGIVSKTSDVVLSESPIGCITHSAQVTYGNSGGPLVDSNGAVIGINTIMSNEEGNHDYFFSTKINEVREVLDALGIEYLSTSGSESAPVGESEQQSEETAQAQSQDSPVQTEAPVDNALRDELESAIASAKATILDNMTQESVSNFNTALAAAEAVYSNSSATEAEIQTALDDLNNASAGLLEKQGMNTTMIIIIAAAAVVVIVVVVIIIIAVTSSSKKKKSAAAAMQQKQKIAANMGSGGAGMMSGGMPGGPAQGPGGFGGFNTQLQRPQNGFNHQPPFSNPAPYSADSDGSTETSVLNDGAGETTLLSGGANLPAAFLVRRKNNERVQISKQVFKIGKERRRVDYCISDNSNVSRAHADIVYKNGAFYLIDNNTTNGTTVNGMSLGRGQEYKLNNGDVVKLADEEFIFQM